MTLQGAVDSHVRIPVIPLMLMKQPEYVAHFMVEMSFIGHVVGVHHQAGPGYQA